MSPLNLISIICLRFALSILYLILITPTTTQICGGSKVHLLLGIKNTYLDPVWIKTLPSGVAVYQSLSKNICGSDLIFAGPHKLFKNSNKSSNANYVIFGIHSAIRKIKEEDNWTDKRQCAMIPDVELQLTVHPHPLNPQDILDVGGVVFPDFEDLVDSSIHIL